LSFTTYTIIISPEVCIIVLTAIDVKRSYHKKAKRFSLKN